MNKKVVILGIDNFSKKNSSQIVCLNNNGFKATVFTNDSLGNSSNIFFAERDDNNLFVLKNTFLSRIFQVYSYLRFHNKNVNHAEVYPGGRFAPFYVLLCKIFGIKIIAVERGDLVDWSEYTRLYKSLLKIVYKYSNVVWYRELYMKKALLDLGVKKIVFIHNCVENKKTPIKGKNSYIFLWVNRLIKQRKTKWFVNAVNELGYEKSLMVGLMGDSCFEKYAEDNRSSYFDVLKYQNPVNFYLKSRFFVLPSDIVFANNALLEAMSYGLVPLVSDVEGARLIVNDGVDGFVFEHSEEGLKNAMLKAIRLSDSEYDVMSNNAIKKIKEKFSYETWSYKYIDMINSI